MSIWSTLAKIGGVAGAPFTGGASLALALGGLGADIAGSVIQGRQISKGVKAQREGTQQALGLQRGLYQQGRADLDPYRQFGVGAAGNLARLVGLPSLPQGQPETFGTSGQWWNSQGPRNTGFAGGAVPPSRSATPFTRLMGQEAMVTVRAPTGETRQVPISQSDHWRKRGALIMQT